MQTASRKFTYNHHGPGNKPQITVEPGEVFRAETELCTGDWLNSIDDVWSPDKTNALNPTVVIAVDGAMPGDVIAVDILKVEPAEIGYTGFYDAPYILANVIKPHHWGQNVKTVRIDGEYVHWSDKLKLPVAPMIGTLGTAPAEEVLSNAKGGVHGGNMDIQEVCAGNTVYLPVEVPGALLHIGDVHAIQGDGEVNGSGGIECASVVEMRVRIVKRPDNFKCVRIENDAFIMTAACCRSIEESFYLACEQMLCWMTSGYGFTLEEAYLLMGQVLEARVTQFVNPTRSYIVKMPKKYLVAE